MLSPNRHSMGQSFDRKALAIVWPLYRSKVPTTPNICWTLPVNTMASRTATSRRVCDTRLASHCWRTQRPTAMANHCENLISTGAAERYQGRIFSIRLSSFKNDFLFTLSRWKFRSSITWLLCWILLNRDHFITFAISSHTPTYKWTPIDMAHSGESMRMRWAVHIPF